MESMLKIPVPPVHQRRPGIGKGDVGNGRIVDRRDKRRGDADILYGHRPIRRRDGAGQPGHVVIVK